MITTEPNMTNLFLQLGLEESEEHIAAFIRDHQLPADIKVNHAPFWSEGQRNFLTESLGSDNDWAIVVDELNEVLHRDATAQSSAG